MECWCHLDLPKLPPGGLGGGQKYPENTIKKAIMALVAPNGWISMDLGWIWVGYIQGGLLVTFVPTEISKLPSGCSGVWGGAAKKHWRLSVSGFISEVSKSF